MSLVQANFRAHYTTTGPEIWAQTAGAVDAFVAAAGVHILAVSDLLHNVFLFFCDRHWRHNSWCFVLFEGEVRESQVLPGGSTWFWTVQQGIEF